MFVCVQGTFMDDNTHNKYFASIAYNQDRRFVSAPRSLSLLAMVVVSDIPHDLSVTGVGRQQDRGLAAQCVAE